MPFQPQCLRACLTPRGVTLSACRAALSVSVLCCSRMVCATTPLSRSIATMPPLSSRSHPRTRSSGRLSFSRTIRAGATAAVKPVPRKTTQHLQPASTICTNLAAYFSMASTRASLFFTGDRADHLHRARHGHHTSAKRCALDLRRSLTRPSRRRSRNCRRRTGRAQTDYTLSGSPFRKPRGRPVTFDCLADYSKPRGCRTGRAHTEWHGPFQSSELVKDRIVKNLDTSAGDRDRMVPTVDEEAVAFYGAPRWCGDFDRALNFHPLFAPTIDWGETLATRISRRRAGHRAIVTGLVLTR